MYKQILIKTKITTWKERSNTKQIGRSPLRGRRSVLDCSATSGGGGGGVQHDVTSL